MMFRVCHALLALVSLLALPSATAAVITIVSIDGAGEGLNDATPATPVGGNAGVTIGEQRMNVFRRAAEIWGARITSSVEIEVWARFDPLACDNNAATLGQARAFTFFRDFVGAPRPGTLYPVALGNRFAGLDLDPQNPDIIATFNSSLGQSGCLPTAHWYYGLDKSPPANTYDLLVAVLHELGHGLGFTTLIDFNTGAKNFGFDDVYMLHLEDHSTGKLFPVMSNAERAAAMRNPGNLHWAGPVVVSQSGFLVSGRHPSGHVEIYAPAALVMGSSVSHYSNSLFPDELMEPFLVGQTEDRLATALLADLGWGVVQNAPSMQAAGSALLSESCPPGNQAIDPGESVTVQFRLRNSGVGVTDDVVATLLPSAGIVFPGPPQSYGALAGGGSPVSRPFTFTAIGTCGQTITATLQLMDGTDDLGTASFVLSLGGSSTKASSATNASNISIPAVGRIGTAQPYPSTLQVSGISDPVRNVSVSLFGLTHGLSADVDILLVGPRGQSVMLMSDVGNGGVSEVNLLLDDQAAVALPGADPLASGTFRPTNLSGSETFPSPAPGPPHDATLSVFNDTDVNGTWSLYINDDRNQNSGSLSGGWALHFTTAQQAECCRVSDLQADVAASLGFAPNPVAVGSNVVCTVLVTNAGPNAAFGVGLFSQVPPGLAFQTVQSSQGNCTFSNGALSCDLGYVSVAQSITISVSFLAQTPGPASQTIALVSQSTDPNPLNDMPSAILSIQARPTISQQPDLTILEDAPTLVLPVLVGDADTPAAALTLSARFTNTNLVSAAGVFIGGTESNRTVTLTPASDQFGLTALFVTVSDGYGTASDLILLTVTSVNDPPTFVPGPNISVQANAGPQVFPQWAQSISPGPTNEASQTLEFIVGHDAPALFAAAPAMAVDGTLTFTPAPGASGSAGVSITLKDNGGRLNQGMDQSPPYQCTIAIAPAEETPPRIESIRYELSKVTLTWEAMVGRHYGVQFRTNLLQTDWEDLVGDVTAAGPQASASDMPVGPQRFYRVYLKP